MSRPMIRRRTIRNWTPDQGDGNEWLARLESEGWVPEYGAGVRVRINGRDLVRYAFLATDDAGMSRSSQDCTTLSVAPCSKGPSETGYAR